MNEERSIMAYYASAYDLKLLTREEEIELANRIKNGDKSAEKRFFGAKIWIRLYPHFYP